MEIQEVIKRLKNFDYPAQEYSGTVIVEVPSRTAINRLTRDEIHAVLKHEVPMQNIRQVDPWTIVITF